MRRFLIVLTVIAMMLGACGCSMQHVEETKDTHPAVVLTERQIRILEQEGLPTDYEQLDSRQQRAICAIEEMMAAVEEKYGVAFGYISYSDGGGREAEMLTLYPQNGDRDTDVFTVTREEEDGAYVCRDGYAALMAKPAFAAFVQSHAQQLGENSVKVYSVVFHVEEGMGAVTEENVAHHVDGDSWIFVDGGSVAREAFEAYAAAFRDWRGENGITGAAQLILLKEDTLQYLTEFNYSDYLSAEYYEDRIFINP